MPRGKGEKPTDLTGRYDEDFLAQMDGRVRVAKSLRERLGALVSDLGGMAALSYQEQSLCKRIVHIERLIEKDELTLAHNGTIDRHAHFAALTTLSSLFSKLGLKRRAKQLPSLQNYLSERSASPSTKED